MLLPWHQDSARELAARFAAGRLPHGLLLTAPAGWGEQRLANWLALHLLGIHEERMAEQLAHPDLRWIRPEGAVTRIEEVRAVVSFAVGTPQAAACKVVVLVDADTLNRNAGNALLKTLEEPPPGTYLLLTTCHPGRLLPTIRSRCQVVNVKPDAAAARRWLESSVRADDLDARIFEHGGAPLAVLEGLERGEAPLGSLLAGALAAARPGAVVEVLLEQGLLDVTGRWYRHLVAAVAGRGAFARLAASAPAALLTFADELLWARRQLIGSNSANERLLAERLVQGWRQLGRRAPVTS